MYLAHDSVGQQFRLDSAEQFFWQWLGSFIQSSQGHLDGSASGSWLAVGVCNLILQQASLGLYIRQWHSSKRYMEAHRTPEAQMGNWHMTDWTVFCCLEQVTRQGRLKRQGNKIYPLTEDLQSHSHSIRFRIHRGLNNWDIFAISLPKVHGMYFSAPF